ncbi:MAG: glutamate--tRNA ligase, partial [Planctomycetota bacterium]
LEAAEPFRADVLEEALRGLCAELEVGLGKVAQPVRVSVTGTNVSAELFKTLELLGKERTLNRIRRALSFIESGDFPYSEEE